MPGADVFSALLAVSFVGASADERVALSTDAVNTIVSFLPVAAGPTYTHGTAVEFWLPKPLPMFEETVWTHRIQTQFPQFGPQPDVDPVADDEPGSSDAGSADDDIVASTLEVPDLYGALDAAPPPPGGLPGLVFPAPPTHAPPLLPVDPFEEKYPDDGAPLGAVWSGMDMLAEKYGHVVPDDVQAALNLQLFQTFHISGHSMCKSGFLKLLGRNLLSSSEKGFIQDHLGSNWLPKFDRVLARDAARAAASRLEAAQTGHGRLIAKILLDIVQSPQLNDATKATALAYARAKIDTVCVAATPEYAELAGHF
uniref:Uncharacterized protein n=1 Tax=Marseillevirus LCMAC103 TaxID=2506604 RepID=A0A481YWP7_9VIRU|nr:MAG: hypothetical protein LCMAC103_03280 [Marseillevirus LCMAC103]